MVAIASEWIMYASSHTRDNRIQEFWFGMKDKRLIQIDESQLLGRQYLVVNFQNTDEKMLVAKAVPTISAQTLVSIAGNCSCRFEDMDFIFTRAAHVRYSSIFGDGLRINASAVFQSECFWCRIACIIQECMDLIYGQGLQRFLSLEMKVTPVLHEMFDAPYPIDAGRANEAYRNIKKELAGIRKQLKDKNTARGRAGGTEPYNKEIQSLTRQRHKLEDKLIRFPKVLAGTKQGKLYISSNFRSIGTDTFRISTFGVNIQGFPKELRKCLLPRYGNKLIEYDITCSQLIMLAGLAGEDLLIQCYMDNIDLYAFICTKVLGKPQDEITEEERGVYKTIVLQILYGAGTDTIRTGLQGIGCMMNNGEIRAFKEKFYRSFPAIKKYSGKVKAAEDITLPTGRRYGLKNIRPYARLAYVLQYVEAEVLRRILMELYDRSEEMGYRIYLCIHDSVFVETSNDDIASMGKSIQGCFERAVSMYFSNIKNIKVKENIIYE